MSARIGDNSAAERNKTPIFDALAAWLDGVRDVLEVGAGDATHARHAVRRFPHLEWQTSEAPGHHRRLVATLAGDDDPQLAAPIALDVRGEWPEREYDLIYGANVAHIMDWAAVCALFAQAGSHLRGDGLLCLYGPFIDDERPLESSNAAFDEALRARDPAMGLRRVQALDALADAAGLERVADRAMPSNNRLLLFKRRPT